MQLSVILTQMGVIAIFLALGFLSKRKGWIHTAGTKDLSWILINICAPAQVIFSVLGNDSLPDSRTSLKILILSILIYIVLIISGRFIGPIIRAPRSEWKFYHVMAVFGNTGFLGLPLCQAILGNNAMVYLVLFNISYQIFFYTWALMKLQPDEDERKVKFSFRRFLNPGTVGTGIALICLFTGLRFPGIINESTRYMANAVTFMSVYVIGANLADNHLSVLLRSRESYLFLVIRQILIPIAFVLIMKQFIADPYIIGAFAIGLAVPVGNAASMAAATNGCDLKTLTTTTVFTTMLSVITMTIVLVVAM